MDRITLTIGGKQYTITLEEPFAKAVKEELREVFEEGRDNDVKVLLQAYLTKQIAYLEMEAGVRRTLEKLSEIE